MVEVKVGGEYACFSRPEFKVERVSYPVMTPSAARGVLEAIYWKPEFRYFIREIAVLKPVRQMTVLRNEIADRQDSAPFFVEDRRQQRVSLILRDVEYIIRADVVPRSHADHPAAKYVACFERRRDRGRCHHTPCMGTREFAAWFEPPDGSEVALAVSPRIGRMLFDLAYVEDAGRAELKFRTHGASGRCIAAGYAEAVFFDADQHFRDGVLRPPAAKYAEILRLEGHDAQ